MLQKTAVVCRSLVQRNEGRDVKMISFVKKVVHQMWMYLVVSQNYKIIKPAVSKRNGLMSIVPSGNLGRRSLIVFQTKYASKCSVWNAISKFIDWHFQCLQIVSCIISNTKSGLIITSSVATTCAFQEAISRHDSCTVPYMKKCAVIIRVVH